MAYYQKFNCFLADLAHGVHNLGSDEIMVALCAAANAPDADDEVLADLTIIDHTNLSSRIVVITSSGQTSGIYKLIADDLELTASATVPDFRYVVLFNNTTENKNLICFWDKGSTVSLPDPGDSFEIDFNQTDGILSLQLA